MLFITIVGAVFVGMCLFQIRLFIFAIILGLVLLAAAHAAPAVFPAIDIESACRSEISEMSAEEHAQYPDFTIVKCLEDAQAHATGAKLLWDKLPEASRKDCLHAIARDPLYIGEFHVQGGISERTWFKELVTYLNLKSCLGAEKDLICDGLSKSMWPPKAWRRASQLPRFASDKNGLCLDWLYRVLVGYSR